MNTETVKTSVKTQNPAIRKKISVKTIKLSDQPVGFSFKGKFVGLTKGNEFNTLDEKTGEIITKHLQFAIFEDLETGERISYVADKGLTDQLNVAMVTQGQNIEVIKLEQVKLTKGRKMNQYDIFDLGK